LAAATRAFDQPQNLTPPHCTYDHGHGREETRKLTAITVAPNEPEFASFPEIRQILKIERTRFHHRTGQTDHEIAYAITNAQRSQLPPARAAQAVRNHWQVENNLHRQKDVRMREDDDKTHTRHAPHNLATMRNLALTVVNLVTAPATPSCRWRVVKRQPWRALKLLGI
jgi:predicted transposase YbfD/YdcC